MPAATAGSERALADPLPFAADIAPAPAAARTRWADLGLRLASSLVLLPLAVLCVWNGGLAWLLVVAVATLLLLAEWVAMWRKGGETGSLLAAGSAYILLAAACLLWLRTDPLGRSNLLFLLIVVWSGDIGAYLAGRWIGGPRLAPVISPGKTWSGAAGGLLASAIAGALAARFWPHGALTAAILLATLIGLAAQLGDLLESGAKRICGVKDSGHLIPGHGGLLDRLDGVLLAAPLVAFLGIWLGRGIALWN